MAELNEKDFPPLFGTNGIRGVPNDDLTVEFSQAIGKSIGTFFGSKIAMGRDTRDTGQMIFDSVCSGILSSGCDLIDLGILPTPAIQYYCKINKMPGVIITASHNPPQFNGIKCIAPDGTELERESERKIELIYYNKKYLTVNWDKIGRVFQDNNAPGMYVAGVMSKVDRDNIRSRNFKVVVDTGNGAAFSTTPTLLRELGCRVVTLNANPDGKFTSRNSEPRPENLTELISVMKLGKFDLGVAHDGDADRAVFVDEKGNFIDGDVTLSLIVKNHVKKGEKVVTPVSSSDALSEICKAKGAQLIRTRVGAPIVSRTMIKEKALLGGEENGGVIFGPHQYCRDGAMTLSLFLDLMASTGMKPSELIKTVPEFHMAKESVKREKEWSVLEKDILKQLGDVALDRTDGLKIMLVNGWVLLRPSGTEPIIRIYGESRDEKTAKEIANDYKEMIEKLNRH